MLHAAIFDFLGGSPEHIPDDTESNLCAGRAAVISVVLEGLDSNYLPVVHVCLTIKSIQNELDEVVQVLPARVELRSQVLQLVTQLARLVVIQRTREIECKHSHQWLLPGWRWQERATSSGEIGLIDRTWIVYSPVRSHSVPSQRLGVTNHFQVQLAILRSGDR